MEWHQEPKWISKGLVDLELQLTPRKSFKERQASGINGQMRALSLLENHRITKSKFSTQMLLLQEQSLCTTFLKLFSYTSLSVFIVATGGKTSRLSFQMLSSLVKENTRSWTLSDPSALNKTTMWTLPTVFMAPTQISSCWVLVPMSLTSISSESLWSRTIPRRRGLVAEEGDRLRYLKLGGKRKSPEFNFSFVRFLWWGSTSI